MKTALILDTETTGLKDPEVIEFAYSFLHDGPNWQWDEATTVTNWAPTKPIEWGAIATHHILPADLIGRPVFNGLIPPVDYFIGHNVDYDWKALGSPPTKRIDTLALSRLLWPTLDSHKLGAMFYFLNGVTHESRELLRSAHSAAVDVYICKTLLKHILKKLGCGDLDRLWTHSEDARVPRVMTFGKFKDQPISAVDRGYAQWYRKQPDTDPYVLEAFKRAGLL